MSSNRWHLGAALLLGLVFPLINCGGGGGGGGAQVDNPPTLVISDNVPGSIASGNVTFTFTFSEPIQPSFTATSVDVAGATKGTFTRVSSTVSKLVTVPPDGTSGTITVTIPANSFSDEAGNKNTKAYTATQAYGAETWNLVWSDEFDTPGALDSSKWRFETGLNWYNDELQAYTDSSKNARVEGGNLVIEAINEVYQTKNFTSARVNSKGSWTYGRMEVKAKLPRGNKLWPAIWMMPDASPYGIWPASGEIDIMENWSWAQSTIYGTIHTSDYNHVDQSQKGGNLGVTDPSANWHVYVLEWFEDQMRWYVDDTHYFTFYNEGTHATWPFDHPFHFIFNIAVEKNAIAADPSWTKRTMEIDYVRVYSGPITGPVPPVVNLPGKVEAEDWTRMLGVWTEPCSEGTLNAGWLDAKDWLEYKVNVPVAGSYTINFRVATQNAGASFNLLLDGVSTGTVDVPNTGGWQTWTTVGKDITLSAGEHTLRIAPTVGFNLNWFEVLD